MADNDHTKSIQIRQEANDNQRDFEGHTSEVVPAGRGRSRAYEDRKFREQLFKRVYEKIDNSENALQSNEQACEHFKNVVNARQTMLRNTIDECQLKIGTDQKAYETAIWSILTGAVQPLSQELLSTMSSPVQVSTICDSTTTLYKQCEDLLVESTRLMTLYETGTSHLTIESRCFDLGAGLQNDKSEVVTVLAAGKQLSILQIQRRLAHGNDEAKDDIVISEDEKKKGNLLLQLGTQQDASPVHHAPLGKIADGITKALSRVEKVVQ